MIRITRSFDIFQLNVTIIVSQAARVNGNREKVVEKLNGGNKCEHCRRKGTGTIVVSGTVVREETSL